MYNNIATQQDLKQPPVLKLSLFTAMCERAGFYVLSFLIVLYAKNKLGLGDTQAFIMFGVFTALSYLATVVGGYIADNVFGIRRCIIAGLCCETLGLAALAIPYSWMLPIALASIIIGVGLFKTGPTHILGRSYKEHDPRIDGGFTWYYMGMNIGTLISSLMIGYIQEKFGWSAAFLFGSFFVACGLGFYFLFKNTAAEYDSKPGLSALPALKWLGIGTGALICLAASAFLVSNPNMANIFLVIATILLAIYHTYEIIRAHNKEEKLKIIACLSLIVMAFIFFVLYQQAYTSMVLFINRSVNRFVGGHEIPTVAFFALNPFWVIVFSPILAGLYKYITKKRGRDLPITLKFPIGLLVTSGCFWALVFGAYFANTNAEVSPWWVVLAYAFYTLGELLVCALGVAMITHIAPKRMYGIMMGTWFLVGMSLSASLSGVFASMASIPENIVNKTDILHVYSLAFTKIGAVSLILAIVCFFIGPYIKKMAKL